MGRAIVKKAKTSDHGVYVARRECRPYVDGVLRRVKEGETIVGTLDVPSLKHFKSEKQARKDKVATVASLRAQIKKLKGEYSDGDDKDRLLEIIEEIKSKKADEANTI